MSWMRLRRAFSPAAAPGGGAASGERHRRTAYETLVHTSVNRQLDRLALRDHLLLRLRASVLSRPPCAASLAMDKLTAAPRVGGARTSTGGGGRAATTAVGEYKGAPTATSFAAFPEEGAGLKLCVFSPGAAARLVHSGAPRAVHGGELRGRLSRAPLLSSSPPPSLPPPLRRRSPATVLTASLGFIVSVVVLHIYGRFASS